MDDDQKVSRALDSAFVDEHLSDLLKDMSEFAIDTVTDNEVLKDIPVLSTLANVVGITKRVREDYLARKLFIIVTDAGRIPTSERLAFAKRFERNQRAREQLFELLVHVLDEVRSAERVKMVSALFSALVRGIIVEAAFRRLCDLVPYLEHTHLDTLRTLSRDVPKLVTGSKVQILVLHELAEIDFTPHADGHGFRCKLGELGQELLKGLAQPGAV